MGYGQFQGIFVLLDPSLDKHSDIIATVLPGDWQSAFIKSRVREIVFFVISFFFFSFFFFIYLRLKKSPHQLFLFPLSAPSSLKNVIVGVLTEGEATFPGQSIFFFYKGDCN